MVERRSRLIKKKEEEEEAVEPSPPSSPPPLSSPCFPHGVALPISAVDASLFHRALQSSTPCPVRRRRAYFTVSASVSRTQSVDGVASPSLSPVTDSLCPHLHKFRRAQSKDVAAAPPPCRSSPPLLFFQPPSIPKLLTAGVVT
jgi:hypothetical protein